MMWDHIIIIAVALIGTIQNAVAGSQTSSLLDLPGGFKLKAKLYTRLNDNEEIITTEYYSNQQKRSRIDINGLYAPRSTHAGNSFKYYFDGSSLVMLTKASGKEKYCRKMESILYDLFGELYTEKHIHDWRVHMTDVPDYVNGLARLLLMIDANRDQLTKTNLSNGSVKIRNRYVDRYVYKGKDWAGNGELEIYAYFKTGTEVSEPSNIPLRVYFNSGRGLFFIDYSSVQPIDTSDSPNQLDYHLDPFTFPLGYDCSQELLPVVVQKELREIPKVVSMQLEVEDVWIDDWRLSKMLRVDRSISREFIAYDGFQKVMRRDTINMSPYDDLSTTVYSTTIHDFKNKKYYNIRRNFLDQTDDDDHHLDDDNTSSSGIGFNKLDLKLDSFAECAVARAPQSLEYESLLPLASLSMMGTAVVRGIKTTVLERSTIRLPQMIFQQVLFKDYKEQDTPTFSPIFSPADDHFNVVYYVAHDFAIESQTELGPIVRIDVYHQTHKIYQVDVYDMVWQLSEAPNGDHQTELFSLRDYCGDSGSNKLERTASLVMELEFVGDERQSLEDINKLLENPLIRNKAVMRGLTSLKDLDIPAVGLNELESRVRLLKAEEGWNPPQKDRFEVVVSAKVANTRDQVYSASTIATVASLTPEALPTDSDTFPECFWEAAHARSSGPVLFAYYGGQCYIDFSPKLEWSQEDKMNHFVGSTVFNINWSDGSKHELLQFRIDADQPGGLIPTRDIYRLLDGRQLDLQVVDMESPSAEAKQLKFQVTRVEVNNNKWTTTNDLNGQQAEDEEEILKGLGLVGGVQQSSGSPQSQMDWNSCQSSCVVDLDCRSYSVCVTNQKIECITSRLPFRDPKLLSKVKNATEALKKQPNRSQKVVIDFEQPKATDPDDQMDYNPGGSVLYELKVDRRCRIYNKRALELFREQPKTLTAVEKRNIRWVSSEEECAEVCLSKNMKFFRKMAKLRLRSLNKDDLVSLDNGHYLTRINELRQIYLDNLRSWCSRFEYLNLRAVKVDKLDFIADVKDKEGICLISQPAEQPKETTTDKTGESKSKKKDKKKNKKKEEEKKKKKNENKTNKNKKKVMMDTFDFEYKSLYQMQTGVRLLEWVPEEEPSSEQAKKSRLENRQLVIYSADWELCARECFTQGSGLKPFCKSFDVVEKRMELSKSGSGNNKGGFYISRGCVFNSISLAEARKSGGDQEKLITSATQPNTKVFHFEPRDEYMLDGFVTSKLLQQELERSFAFMAFSSGLSTFLVVLVAIVSGVALGHYAKGPIGRWWAKSHGGPNIPIDSPMDGLIEGDKLARETARSQSADGL